MKKITVFLSDWQVLFREGVHFALCGEDDIEVIGETTSNNEALSFIETNLPRIAILDINRNRLSGIEITRRIKQSVSSVSVILFMDSKGEQVLFSVVKSGASACLTKEIEPDDLVNIIRGVAQGQQPISKELLRPALAVHVLDEFEAYSSISRQSNMVLARLNVREAKLLQLIGERSSPEQVATELGMSKEAVSDHLDVILSKLVTNDHSRQLIEAMQLGRESMKFRASHEQEVSKGQEV